MIHLQNISLFPIFYRTQVLPTVQKFSEIFDKKFFYTPCFLPLNFTSPKASQKFSKSFFRTFHTFFTSTFSMFETCSCQRFLLSKFLAFALLVTFVEKELAFEPSLFKTSSLWFTYPPMLVHNSLTHHASNLQLEKDFHAD